MTAERRRFREEVRGTLRERQGEREAARSDHQEAERKTRKSLEQTQEAAERSYTENFVTQVSALGELTSEPGSTEWWTKWMIMLLFLMVETAPILNKLLTKRGPYDEVLSTVEETVKESQPVYKDALLRLRDARTARQELHTKQMEDDIYRNVMAVQVALNKHAVDIWAAQQRTAIDTYGVEPQPAYNAMPTSALATHVGATVAPSAASLPGMSRAPLPDNTARAGATGDGGAVQYQRRSP